MRLPEFISRWLIDFWRWFALATIVVIGGIGYLALLAGKIETVRTEGLVKRTQTAERLAADTAYRNALKASADEFAVKISSADRATVAAFIPTGSDFPTLLLTVQDIVQRAGLTLADLSVTEVGQVTAAGATADATATAGSGTAVAQAATVQGVNLRTQDVSVTVNGIRSYADVKNLVAIIESSRRLFDVISINFNLSTNLGQAEGTANEGSPISFTLRTYYLPVSQ